MKSEAKWHHRHRKRQKLLLLLVKLKKQETSEDLEETTDMPEETTKIATVATETEASEESAVCNLCVTLKAKVVAMEKKCLRLSEGSRALSGTKTCFGYI